MNRQDWLLLALGSSRHGTLTPVQAQKAMFLLGQEAKGYVGDGFYAFEPYNYGPFCSSVYSDLEAMAREGKVEIRQIPGRRWSVYAITPAGKAAAEATAKQTDGRVLSYLEKVVNWIGQLSFQQLVRAIYDKYPAFKANSVFRA